MDYNNGIAKFRNWIAWSAVALGILIASGSQAIAKSSYLSSFNQQYGTSGTKLDTCTLCHPNYPNTSRNPFGVDFRDAGHSYNASLEGTDSDGDGFTNLEEIEALTFPGDAASKPAAPPPPPPPSSDTTPPSVSSTAPADGASNVAANAPVAVTFSETVDASTLTASSFQVSAGGAGVGGTVTVSGNGKTATFTPASDLLPGTVYAGTVTTAVRDLAGNPLGVPYDWTFTTVASVMDTDGDGVPDGMDSFPHDNRMATVENPSGTGAIMIDASNATGTALMEIAAKHDTDAGINQENKPEGFAFPDGMVAFRLAGVPVGGTVRIDVTFPNGIPEGSKVYKTDALGFHEYTDIAVDGNTVTLLLTDGGAGDSDGRQNGMIDDPVGIATPVAASVPPAPSSAGSGGCSVAGSGADGTGAVGSFGPVVLVMIALALRRREGGTR